MLYNMCSRESVVK